MSHPPRRVGSAAVGALGVLGLPGLLLALSGCAEGPGVGPAAIASSPAGTGPTSAGDADAARADGERLALVNGAIDSGPAPARSAAAAEGGGSAIVRADQPFAEIRLPGVPAGRFTVRALCLGHGTVLLTVRGEASSGSARAAGTVTATVRCGFSESHGRDVVSGLEAAAGLTVGLRAIGQSDGAIAYRIRGG